MSRRFKKRLSVAERKIRRDLEEAASRIPHDAALKTALEQCEPHERNQMARMIAPYLSFVPSEENLACAVCGTHRGAIKAHECTEPVFAPIVPVVAPICEPLTPEQIDYIENRCAVGTGFFKLEYEEEQDVPVHAGD